jgi:hypothetical protein
VVVWVSATIEVDAQDVERQTAFWTAVTGGTLPGHLSVEAGSEPGVRVRVHDGSRVPPVPEPVSFPGVRRTRVYQVCIDIPGPLFDAEAEAWARRVGGSIQVLDRRREFAWLRLPGGPHPLDVLLQRLDRDDGPMGAHLDVGTTDRTREVLRHLDLGAALLVEEEFWTVLADPAGTAYCITDRDPATGRLV